MASKMVGRATCPECGFASAHVKESEKCLYRYCPECGSQHYARSTRQRADLTSKTRIDATATATATGKAPAAEAPKPAAEAPATVAIATPSEATATATGQPKRRGLFS